MRDQSNTKSRLVGASKQNSKGIRQSFKRIIMRENFILERKCERVVYSLLDPEILYTRTAG